MLCDACGTENGEGRKFCKECGATLATVCSSCGSRNETDAKFCGSCGSGLGTGIAPAAIPASSLVPSDVTEQRFVSVLFADIVGYTTLSEFRDSEDIRDMLTVYFDRSQAIIDRFGGTVDKFIGDAVMGVWGSRVAREDDAQRAVRAALELVDMVAGLGEELDIPDLLLRAGVNSGRTSVGPGGNDKGLVVGDLVNTASRLQSIADPGTVFVGKTTRDVTHQAIDYLDVGERTVKGKKELVPAFQALRVASTVAGRVRDEIREPPFTGRDRELRLIKDGLAAVQAEQRARMISIVGEGGIGKTRLAEEFKKHIDGYSEHIYWHWGRSPSYGEGVTFWALGEIVRRRAGIAEGDDPAHSRTRLRTMLIEFVADQSDRDWIEPTLAGLLGLAEMPSGSRSELFATLRSFFQNIAVKGPVVLVFEDLHWADSGLLDFIGELVERSTKSPILVITLARVDLLDRIPDWGSQHRSSMAVRLAPLPEADMRRLVTEYLPGLDDHVVDRIVHRVAGFPLYAVEIVRMLVGSGELTVDGERFAYTGDPAEMALPDSLHAVIGARLDRLEPNQRSLLQDGAVLGHTFTLEAIANLRGESARQVEEALAPLIRFELLDLEDDPRSPERGQYGFVQSLIREVAYQRLSRDDRRSKHLAVAEYFAGFDDPEQAGVVAGHYMDAYEATPAGEVRDALVGHALAALTGAAARAGELHSNLQALDLLEEAIALAPDEALKAAIRLKVGPVASAQAEVERGLVHLAAARAFYDETDDLSGIRRAATAQSKLLNDHGRSDEAYAVIAPVYGGLDRVDDTETIALADEAARSFALNGHEAEAIAAADRVLENTVHVDLPETYLNTLITKGTSLGGAGRRLEGITLLRGAAIEAENLGYRRELGRALNNLAATLDAVDPREALRVVEQRRELTKRTGDLAWIVGSTSDLISLYIADGRYPEAEALLDEMDGEEVNESVRAGFAADRSHLRLRQHPSVAARDAHLASISYFDGKTDRQISALARFAKAQAHAEMGEWEEAFSLGMSVEPNLRYDGLWIATHAVVWLADEEKLRQVAEATNMMPMTGFGKYVEAIGQAWDGDTNRSAALFTEVLDHWKTKLLGVQLAQARVGFARAVGTEHPGAAQAAADAYQWCVDTGTHSYLSAWAPVMPPSDSAVASTG